MSEPFGNTIQNGCNVPIDLGRGTIPDVSGAMYDTFQTMSFNQVTKTLVKGFVKETQNAINFMGNFFPFSYRDLFLTPQDQRSWSWYWIFADPVLKLQTDDIVVWNGKPTRVMGRLDYTMHGYVAYRVVQDWIIS
jgi:hypothetical protein